MAVTGTNRNRRDRFQSPADRYDMEAQMDQFAFDSSNLNSQERP